MKIMDFIQGLRKEMKVALVIIFVILIGYLSYLYWVSLNLADHTVPHIISIGAIGEDAIVGGEVIDIDSTPMAVDGDGLITIRTVDYGDIIISIPARERLCKAKGLENFFELQVGDEVEASGAISSKNKVTPCTSADHYLKILGEDKDVALTGIDSSDWQTYRNEEFGFEFEYPSAGWEISVVHPGHTDFVGPDEEKNIIIDIIAMKEGKTIESIMFRRLACAGDFCEPRTGSPPADFSSRIPLGEHSFFFTSISSYQSAGPHIVYYYLLDSKNNRLIAFRLTLAKGYGATPYYEYGLEEEPNYNTLNQILSTFRFVDAIFEGDYQAAIQKVQTGELIPNKSYVLDDADFPTRAYESIEEGDFAIVPAIFEIYDTQYDIILVVFRKEGDRLYYVGQSDPISDFDFGGVITTNPKVDFTSSEDTLARFSVGNLAHAGIDVFAGMDVVWDGERFESIVIEECGVDVDQKTVCTSIDILNSITP